MYGNDFLLQSIYLVKNRYHCREESRTVTFFPVQPVHLVKNRIVEENNVWSRFRACYRAFISVKNTVAL